jgi:hypothetical protein
MDRFSNPSISFVLQNDLLFGFLIDFIDLSIFKFIKIWDFFTENQLSEEAELDQFCPKP